MSAVTRMCTCATHCPLSGYHERACCEKTTCECWCHQSAGTGETKGIENELRFAARNDAVKDLPLLKELIVRAADALAAETRARVAAEKLIVEARRLLAFVVSHSNARYVLTDSFLSDTLAWTNESLDAVPLSAALSQQEAQT